MWQPLHTITIGITSQPNILTLSITPIPSILAKVHEPSLSEVELYIFHNLSTVSQPIITKSLANNSNLTSHERLALPSTFQETSFNLNRELNPEPTAFHTTVQNTTLFRLILQQLCSMTARCKLLCPGT